MNICIRNILFAETIMLGPKHMEKNSNTHLKKPWHPKAPTNILKHLCERPTPWNMLF